MGGGLRGGTLAGKGPRCDRPMVPHARDQWQDRGPVRPYGRVPPGRGPVSSAAMTLPAAPRRLIVALDGPASSGKSSVGAAAAARLGLRFFDTGLIYRALTALALAEDVRPDDAGALVPLAARLGFGDDGSGRLTRVLLDGDDASASIHNAAVDAAVSTVASIPEVRAALLGRQRELAAGGGIVMVGRDVGTVVLPDATLKVYLDASVESRAARRIAERGLDPAGPEADEVREQLRLRDLRDSTREVAPLRPAPDAIHVANDGAFADTVDAVVAAIEAAAEGRSA